MFTGIVEGVGRVAAVEPAAGGARLRVAAGALELADVRVGGSICVGGCCLTVVAIAGGMLDFDVSAETLRCTTGFAPGRGVNLEKALRLADRLDGHLVSGHVDGVGIVTAFDPAESDRGASWLLEIEVPVPLARFIAAKGSIAVDGVSLTTNSVADARFTVNLIPHTLVVTTLGKLTAGTTVNLEVDLVARYVERLYAAPR
ncbi:MAG TPA: riboflavin synthase [Casimicrobiaceae bacterium]|nr:riboflavin synthase [Casimicrobiaceae bacterium]